MARGIGYVVDAGDSGGAVTQNILIVDDNAETCEYLKELLEFQGPGEIWVNMGEQHLTSSGK